MKNVTDKYQAAAAPQIGFECGSCQSWNCEDDTLELRGEHVDGVHVHSDRILCCYCGEENFVYR